MCVRIQPSKSLKESLTLKEVGRRKNLGLASGGDKRRPSKLYQQRKQQKLGSNQATIIIPKSLAFMKSRLAIQQYMFRRVKFMKVTLMMKCRHVSPDQHGNDTVNFLRDLDKEIMN